MLNLSVPENTQLRPRISVIGCGGAGGNAVNNMIRSKLEGVDFIVCNTDAQALTGSLAERRIQLGAQITRGLGAGSKPDVGRGAAEETLAEVMGHLEGANMVFITAGMGGGTGTGAAPVIARAAREAGILTVGVVTKPFHFEGAHRMRLAESGIAELTQHVDTLIIIPNQNLFRIANERTTFADAFKMADDVLYSGVRGVTDLMMMPGLINLDFADIRSVMTEMGKAMMGTGEATGERRALDAAEAAISNPLLDDVSMKGARGVLINITGGLDMTLFEVDEAANRIRDEVDPDANIIFGSTFDESMQGTIRVSVVSTGIDAAMAQRAFQVVNGGRAPQAAPVILREPTPAAATESTPAVAAEAAPEPEMEPMMAEEPAPQPVRQPTTAPVAARTATGGFVAPRPVEPTRQPNFAPAAAPARQDAPQAAPARPSLFARMTGLGGKAKAALDQTPAAQEAARPAPTMGRPAAQPPAAAAPVVAEQARQNQAPARTNIEEDAFDIPAFLRRQAN